MNRRPSIFRPSSRRRSTLITIFVAALLGLASLMIWGGASPVGAAPDDDFHMTSIWCAAGDRADACESGETAESRVVPRDLLDVCYAGLANESAKCQGPDFGDNPEDTVSTVRGNFEGLYPPVFYAAMNPFVSANVDVSILVMRWVNSLVMVVMVTTLFFLLPRDRRFALVASVAVTAVPLSLFIISSVNPSSWAIISASTLWIALLGYFETTGIRKIALGLFAVVAAVVGAGARADAAVYAVLAVGLVVILKFALTRRFLIDAILPFVICAIALAFYLAAGQSGASTVGGFGAFGSGSPDRSTALSTLLPNIPFLWSGAFGQWGLGWLDTGMYPLVWFCSLACVLGLIFIGMGGRGYGRRSLAAGALLAAVTLIPTVLLLQSRAIVGELVQPRYILPLLIMLVGVSLVRRPGDPIRLSRAQLLMIIAALSAAQSVALHSNLRRYVSGVDVLGWNLDSTIEWWWLPVVSPMGLWGAGTAAFTLFLVALARPLWVEAPHRHAEVPTAIADGADRSADRRVEYTAGARPTVHAQSSKDGRNSRPGHAPLPQLTVTSRQPSETSTPGP